MVKVSHFVQASHPGTKSEFQSILVNPSAVWRCLVQQRSSLQWLFLRVILSLLVGLVAPLSYCILWTDFIWSRFAETLSWSPITTASALILSYVTWKLYGEFYLR